MREGQQRLEHIEGVVVCAVCGAEFGTYETRPDLVVVLSHKLNGTHEIWSEKREQVRP